jgi:hypothetical protein
VSPDRVAHVLDSADRLTAAGETDKALQLLTDANRQAADPAIEVRLVTARHRAFAAPPAAAGSTEVWPPPVPDAFAGHDGLPEVPAETLTAELLAAALEHHGALLVRGLLTASVTERLLGEVRLAFESAEASARGAPASETSPWYEPFHPDEGYNFGGVERQLWRFGAVLAVEAPRALFHLTEALRCAGVGDLIAEYLGEWPALSAKKTSLRRSTGSPTVWHQDGAFLGDGTRTVNVWTALTPCGVDAPAVEVFARPFADVVPPGTDGALHDWCVGPGQIERLGTHDIAQPEFAPGDALLLNQLTLHRTGGSATMTKERYAVESWFFAPSTYPFEQVPIAF